MEIIMKKLSIFVSAIVGAGLLSGCTTTQAYSPDKLASQYGIDGAYVDTLQTGDGNLRGTVVPVTLANGQQAQLIIPVNQRTDPHALYLHDSTGYHPVMLQDNATRSQLVSSPQVVSRRVEPAHANKRSWEQDALIVGGGAGGGALIGALAGGKKGAAVGAATGGVGGLIYDLATKH
jgi:hypothetical protein